MGHKTTRRISVFPLANRTLECPNQIIRNKHSRYEVKQVMSLAIYMIGFDNLENDSNAISK